MKIGIITMHRVPNFGSALQAYALQHKLFQHGIDNKIIDYIYSYAGYEPSFIRYIYDKVKYYAKVILRRPASMTRFFFFHKKYLRTTFREYTRHDLMYKKAPNFDVYMTGSDQVWNCKFTKGDTNFLLKFAPAGSVRLSYGSSFASSSIPKEYQQVFKEELKKYETILVREKSGVDIVHNLIGKKAEVVCDPTLLLSDKEYHALALKGKLHLKDRYILVYVLDYMYNPYPHIYDIVRKVKDELGYKVIYIGTNAVDPSDVDAIYMGNHIGPLEFLQLMENASFVITTSFHGTAFATIFHKPLFSVVQDTESEDGRMQTLLNALSQKDSLVYYKSEVSASLIHSDTIISKEEKLNAIRQKSEHLLIDSINTINKKSHGKNN